MSLFQDTFSQNTNKTNNLFNKYLYLLRKGAGGPRGHQLLHIKQSMKFINEDDINRMKISVSKVQLDGNESATKRVRK